MIKIRYIIIFFIFFRKKDSTTTHMSEDGFDSHK